MKKYITAISRNVHLGKCLMIAYKVNKQVMINDGFTSDEILIFLKSKLLNNAQDYQGPYGQLFINKKPLLRVSSACITGAFGDKDCSCHVDSIRYLRAIKKQGYGIFIHLPQEGMGRGLQTKLHDHLLRSGNNLNGEKIKPMSFAECERFMFKNERYDRRKYSVLRTILSDLGLNGVTFSYLGKANIKKKQLQSHLGDVIDISIKIV